MSKRYDCCPCCDGVALGDHVGHGGEIEKNRHEVPCLVPHDKELRAERDALRAELDALRGRVAELADGQGHEFAVIITALNAGKISGGDAIRAAEATVRKLLGGPA